MNGRERPPEWPVEPARETADEQAAAEPSETVRRGRRGAASALNWRTLALIGGLLLLVLVVGYFATRGNPDQDKLTANESGTQSAAADPEKLCAKTTTYDLIKRELFRRAAQLRGSDQTAFDQLSGYAVLRMENPVMESEDRSTNAVNCSGSLSLDLPPGVTVVGGRHTLTSDVDYTVQPAADGSGNVVLLRNAEAIIAPLATLARTNQPATAQPQAVPPQTTTSESAQPAPPPQAGPPTPRPPQPEAPPQPQRSQEPPAAVPTNAHPSFDCRRARTKGERAVCSDAGLAALDRNMSAQYVRAISGASPEQQAHLRRTRDRFLAYRDRCPNRSCMGDAYVGRMREIRDIMEGSWHPR